MKELLKSLYCFFEALGRARAAGVFARQGDVATAKRIMTEPCKCC